MTYLQITVVSTADDGHSVRIVTALPFNIYQVSFSSALGRYLRVNHLSTHHNHPQSPLMEAMMPIPKFPPITGQICAHVTNRNAISAHVTSHRCNQV